MKATALRRAATALLVFGMVCARPCPSSWGAWLATLGAIAVLCSSANKLLCRARMARACALFAAIFAGYTFVSLLVSFHAGMPMQFASKVHDQCVTMPAETFTWAHHVEPLRKGISFLSRHMPNTNDTDITFEMNANASAAVLEPDKWSQPEACSKIAHIVACFVKMVTVGS